MPRGNLEIVSPRVFVVQEVLAHLEKRDFALAWKLAKMNSVDLNVIVDYCWPRFLANARDFVTAVSSEDVCLLSILLCPRIVHSQGLCYLMIALTKGSFFGPGSPYWMYLPEGQDASLSTNQSPDKVSSACEALRNAMIEINEKYYFKAIALSYARSVRYTTLSVGMLFRAEVILQT